MSKTRIAFIGAGNMAASLIGGLRAKGLDASQIRASDPGADTRARQAEHGIETFADNAQAIDGVDVIVLAVKPQVMKAVCETLRRTSSRPTGGVHRRRHHLRQPASWLGAQPVVRCMPNTPALLRQGVSGLYATAEVSAEQRSRPNSCCPPWASPCGWTRSSNWTPSPPYPAAARRTSSC
jgi:pyrroline-5-carboxylate reductase